ncbi:MAG: hypothetical protein J6I45_09040 [Clostridia bacterium]|nr:hypothetical protein [Clostridia bacterium]
MTCDYNNFINALTGKGSISPTLFEPFISQSFTEQLIWRRGDTVWQTPESRISALVSLRERTLSDVIALDVRNDSPEIIEALLRYASDLLPEGSALVVMTEDKEAVALSTPVNHVCAIASWNLPRQSDKPFIRMSSDIGTALAEYADGCFAEAHAEDALEAAEGRITVLGGIGADYLNHTGPASIHARCAALMNHNRYILGSGGEVSEYLGLISLLGAYRKKRG